MNLQVMTTEQIQDLAIEYSQASFEEKSKAGLGGTLNEQAKADEAMTFENLIYLNECIKGSLERLKKNPYWNSVVHDGLQGQFNVESVELVLPSKRGGSCSHVELKDGSIKDMITINPVFLKKQMENFDLYHNQNDVEVFIEALIAHELTHAEQLNRIDPENIPTHKLPSLHDKEERKILENSSQNGQNPWESYLFDAIVEGDCRSMAVMVALSEQNASKEVQEAVRHNQQFYGTEMNRSVKFNNRNDLFLDIMKREIKLAAEIKKIRMNDLQESILEAGAKAIGFEKFGFEQKFPDIATHIAKNTITLVRVQQKIINKLSINSKQESKKLKEEYIIKHIEKQKRCGQTY